MDPRTMHRFGPLYFADEPGDEPPEPKDEGGDGGAPPKGRQIPYERFQTVVGERDNARRERDEANTKVAELEARIQELEAEDQTQVVQELQAKVEAAKTERQETENYFSALLEAELADLPEESQGMVNDVPGGPRKRYEFLVKHRARLSPEKEETPKPPAGPSNERKPGQGGGDRVRSLDKDVKTKAASGAYAGL